MNTSPQDTKPHLVRIRDHKHHDHPFTTYEAASKLFRDKIGDRGASMAPECDLLDEAGVKIGYISYNGRCWIEGLNKTCVWPV